MAHSTLFQYLDTRWRHAAFPHAHDACRVLLSSGLRKLGLRMGLAQSWHCAISFMITSCTDSAKRILISEPGPRDHRKCAAHLHAYKGLCCPPRKRRILAMMAITWCMSVPLQASCSALLEAAPAEMRLEFGRLCSGVEKHHSSLPPFCSQPEDTLHCLVHARCAASRSGAIREGSNLCQGDRHRMWRSAASWAVNGRAEDAERRCRAGSTGRLAYLSPARCWTCGVAAWYASQWWFLAWR